MIKEPRDFGFNAKICSTFSSFTWPWPRKAGFKLHEGIFYQGLWGGRNVLRPMFCVSNRNRTPNSGKSARRQSCTGCQTLHFRFRLSPANQSASWSGHFLNSRSAVIQCLRPDGEPMVRAMYIARLTDPQTHHIVCVSPEQRSSTFSRILLDEC